MKLVYTENLHHLQLPAGHKFPLSKYGEIHANLERVYPGAIMLGAPAATHDLLLVHDADYVASIDAGTMSERAVRRLGFPWSPSLALRARRSVGGTLTALSWAMQNGAAGHIAGGTHHAFRDRGEGFCVFNDLAVAVRVAQRDFGVKRVAIIDLDVHQGNGTAAIFANDPSVFTLSLHGARNYPFEKAESALDVPLPDLTCDAAYLEAMRSAFTSVAAFRPELILYQAGVDSLIGDRLGRMALSLAGLKARDALVYDLTKRLAVPLVVTLGGGYGKDIGPTVVAHTNVYLELTRRFQSQ
jgi:acetoin utilization deacetylase AcuC-like enzyme